MTSLEKAGCLQNPFFIGHSHTNAPPTHICISPSIPEALILTNGSQFSRVDVRTGSCTCSGSVRSGSTRVSRSSLIRPSISPLFVEPPVFSAAFSSKTFHSPPYSQHEALSCIVEGGHGFAGTRRPPLLVHAVGTVQGPELLVADLSYGGMYTPIKLSPPPRSTSKGGRGYIKCMAGGKCGIVFVVREGEAVLHSMVIDPPENRGSTSVSVGCTDRSVNALSSAPRAFTVAAAMSNGEVRLYSYASVVESLSSSSSPYNHNPWGSESSSASLSSASRTTLQHMEVEREKMDTTRLNEDFKPPLRPWLRGKLQLTAILESSQPNSCFLCISFHALRHWVCAGGEGGVVAVWSLEDKGVLDVRCENITGKSFHASPPGASTVPKPVLKVHPFAVRRKLWLTGMELPRTNIACIGFHSYEPFVIAVQGVEEVLNSRMSTNKGCKNSQSSNGGVYVSVLSILNAQMPLSGRFPLPYPVSSFALEPASCLLFFSWTEMVSHLDCIRLASGQVPGGWSHSLVGSSFSCPAAVFIEEGLKDNVSSSRRKCTLEQRVIDETREMQLQNNSQIPSFHGVELPLMAYFLRSMVLVINAGPGGGVDIPAIKSILFGQPLERDVKMRERGKPRRLVSLPGHTDDVVHKFEEGGSKHSSSSFFSGHLRPYHIAVGPIVRDKRHFLVAYEIFPTSDWDSTTSKMQEVPLKQQSSRSVCGLVTQPSYGELETEANISRLIGAHDGCFVPVDGYNEQCALLVEAHGFRLSVYDVPELNLISSQELSQPVARVFPVPQNAHSPNSAAAVKDRKSTTSPQLHYQLLYVLRESIDCASTSPGAVDFVEMLVYGSAESGGLPCPQPLTLPSSMSPNATHSFHHPYLRLLPREHILDVGFQPAVASNSEDGKLWGDASGGQLAFVLTTYRVLVVSAVTLEVISSYGNWRNQKKGWREDVMTHNNKKDNNNSFQNTCISVHPLPSTPLSVSWLGGGILVLLDDGQVLMLVPGSNTRIRSVFSIERSLCNGGGTSIVAILPDRICLLVRGGGASGARHLLTKPFMPLEPLLAGLLEPEWRRGTRLSSEQRLLLGKQHVKEQVPEGGEAEQQPNGILVATTAEKIVLRYAPPLKGDPLSREIRPGINAGATKAAFDLLVGFGLTRLSLDVAGIEKSSEPFCGTRLAFFRRRPWIGFGDRCLAAVDEDLPLVAAIEAIGDDPSLVECTCNVDGMVTPYLPRQQSILSRILKIIANWCKKSRRLETARCLLDIAGAEGALIELLKSAVIEGGEDYLRALYCLRNSGKGMLQAVPDLAVTFALSKALGKAGEMAELVQIEPSPSIIQNGAFRHRENLLITQNHALPESKSNPTKLLVEEEEDIDSSLHKRRTAPPSLGLRKLSLSCLEEWTGRTRPECTDDDEGHSLTDLARVSPAVAQYNTSYFSDYVDRSNWATVGTGRDSNDNICGYWRFSEGEKMSGCGVIASLQVENLSKFGGFGEVCGAELLETTSPIDPGDGVTVSGAMDVHFPYTSDIRETHSTQTGKMNSYKTGIFFPCPRGSALDLGLFHNEPRRSLLTVELYVMHIGHEDENALDLDEANSGGYHTLAARYHDSCQNNTNSCIDMNDSEENAFVGSQEGAPCHLWSLTVEKDRRICFMPGPLSRGEAKMSSSGKVRGGVCSEAGAVPIGRWTHVAFTLDASRFEMAADVTLYIDCIPAGRGRCRFNKVPQYAIQKTMLVVGPDLRGWRLTEFRVWAMCRDSDLLDDFKDICLLQAELRKGRIVIRDSPSKSTRRKNSLLKKTESPSETGEGTAGWSDARRLLPPPVHYPIEPPIGDPPPSRDARKIALAAKTGLQRDGSKQYSNTRKKSDSSGIDRRDVVHMEHVGHAAHTSRTDDSVPCLKRDGPLGSLANTPFPPVPNHQPSNHELQGWATFPSDNTTGNESSSTPDQ